eukprot:3436734-Pleurochrysis_carterae.AAC.5
MSFSELFIHEKACVRRDGFGTRASLRDCERIRQSWRQTDSLRLRERNRVWTEHWSCAALLIDFNRVWDPRASTVDPARAARDVAETALRRWRRRARASSRRWCRRSSSSTCRGSSRPSGPSSR